MTTQFVRRLFVLLALLSSFHGALGATKTWSGAGDGVVWSNGLNWVDGVAPVNGDGVGISTGGGNLIELNGAVGTLHVNSLQSNQPLSIVSVALTIGSAATVSSLTVALDFESGSLTLTGAGSNFTGAGQTTLAAVNVTVNGGATATFSGLSDYTQPSATQIEWNPDGAERVLHFQNLASITGSAVTTDAVNSAAH